MSSLVSGALARLQSSRARFYRLKSRWSFNGSGRAGPRRLALIGVSTLALAGLGVLVFANSRISPHLSRDALLTGIDSLPGGLHSTPEQDKLALVATDAEAAAAKAGGVSYTPPLAPSVLASVAGRPGTATEPVPAQRKRVIARTAVSQKPSPETIPAVLRVATVTQAVGAEPAADMPVTLAAAPGSDPQADQAYARQIDSLLEQWGGRPPHTDVILDGPRLTDAAIPGSATPARPAAFENPGADAAAPASHDTAGTVLIPAGRGVFAHPILALNSDQSSPVVLQADSGPISGDRMIGSFARQGDRLVIHVASIIHHGESLAVDGVVTAPDTMEAGVASAIDEHYAARFILPAAAAFVAGLGQAIATTSNTTQVLGPLGGATSSTQLNFHEQLGVAAGVAAQQVANALAVETPKGPTISLEANVAVGVMFLTPVTSRTP